MPGKRSKNVDVGQVFEELEPRLLLSADPLAAFMDTGIAGVHGLSVEADTAAPAVVQHAIEHSAAATRVELVLIDARAPNYQQLYNDLVMARQQGREFHIVVLDAHRDGVEQITEALSRFRGLDAVHIVSHGDQGYMELGNGRLDSNALKARDADIERWKQAFSDSGDLFLYGCSLAATTEGRSLVDSLSRLTATDVAASEDLTGSALHGGDWELEYSAGDVESRIAFSDALQREWTGTLLAQTETVRDEFSTAGYTGNDGTAAWSGDWQETNDSGGASGGAVYIQGGSLVISEDESTPGSIHREADLSAATSATLSYDYKRNTPQAGGLITLDISADGGVSWNNLAGYDLDQADAGFTAEAFDISPYIAANTQIRFTMSGADTTAYLEVDNLQILYGDMANNDAYVVDEDTGLVTHDAWFDSDWQFRRTLSFDNLDRSQNLDEFPVLVALDASRIDYGNTQDNGADLRFTDSDGSLLAHEIESWDESGTSYVWVKVPRVDGASDTDHIRMYYGNPTAPDAQDAAAVWSAGYRAVYHLNENAGATGTIADSAGNFDAVNAGSTGAAGMVGNARDFDGIGQYVDLGHNRFWISGSSASTLSLWMNTDTTSGSGDMLGVTVNGAPDTGASRISLIRNGDNIQMIARSMDDSSDVVSVVTSASPLTAGQWHLVSGTVDYSSDTDNIRVYVDGELVEMFSHDFTLNILPDTSSTNAALGTDEDGGMPYFDGRLDEARISNRLRTADWLSAQHASMTDAFITYSAAQSSAGVLGNDIDPEGDVLTVNTTPVTAPVNGAVVLDADGSFVYTPNADFNGSDFFVYEVTESGSGNTAMASVLITVNAVDDTPDAQPDSFTVDEGATLVLDLAANDSDADGDLDPASITIVSAPAHGSINAVNADGTVEYAHDGSEMTADSFSYTIRDLAGNVSAAATVSLSINAVNDPAVIAGDDTGLVTEDDVPLETSGTLTISDADAVGEEVFVSGITTGAYGSLTINMLGNWSYTADNALPPIQALADGATLTDTMTVHSIDGTPHDVVITITGVNDAAVISGDDSGALTEDDDPDADGMLETSGSLGVTDIDTGEAAFAAGTLAGSYGSLSIDAAGNWSYRADNSQALVQGIAQGDAVTDTVAVAAVDGTTRQIVITISGINDAAVIAGNDTGSVTEDVDPDADGFLETGGTLTITDAEAGEAVFNAGVFNGAYGSLDIDAAGNWSYSADTAQAVIQGLVDAQTLVDTVTVSSADGTTHDITVAIDGINDAPAAMDDSALVAEGGSVTIDLVPNDSDIDSALDLNSIAITGAPAHGALTVHGDGTVTYDHDGSETAADSFSYTIADIGGAISNAATVAITVDPRNDAPVTAADVLTVNEGGSGTIDLAANDTDPDSALDLASIVITDAPAAGSLLLNGDGTATYVHDGSEGGSDGFTYTIADASGAVSNTATVTIDVLPVNDAPVAIGSGTLTVAEDAADSVVDITGYFSDVDDAGADLAYSITGVVDIGLFDYTGLDATTGLLSLDYAADQHGSSEITLRLTDSSGQFAETLLTVTVTPVNDAPVLERNTGVGVHGGNAVNITGDELFASDVEDTADSVTYTVTSVPLSGILLLNGVPLRVNDVFTQQDLDDERVLYQSVAESMSDRFTFTVADASGVEIPAQIFSIAVDFVPATTPAGNQPAPVSVEAENEAPSITTSGDDFTFAFAGQGPVGYQDTYIPFGGSAPAPGSPPVAAADPQPEPEPGPRAAGPAPQQDPRPAMNTADAAGTADVSAVNNTDGSIETVQLQSMRALWSAVDEMKQQMGRSADHRTGLELHITAIETSGIALTAGFVAWAFRSGALMTSLLSTMPVWRGFDPLPVLGYRDDEEEQHVMENAPDSKEKSKQGGSKARPTTAMDIESLFDRSLIGE